MARRTEVLLVKDVLKLGNMGDIVRVAPGYARNFLLPEGLAVPADQATKRQVEVLREKAARNEVEREARARELAQRIDGMTVQVAQRVAHDDELFGSVGTKDIVAALAKHGVQVDGKQVHLTDRIRRLGRYPIEVSLHKTVTVKVIVEVVNSDPNAPSLDETLAQIAARREQQQAERAAARRSEQAAEAEAAGKDAKGGKAAPAKDGKDKPDAKAEAKGGKKDEAKDAKKDEKAGAKAAPAAKSAGGAAKAAEPAAKAAPAGKAKKG